MERLMERLGSMQRAPQKEPTMEPTKPKLVPKHLPEPRHRPARSKRPERAVPLPTPKAQLVVRVRPRIRAHRMSTLR
jgi:hypothetical protein